MIRVAGGTEAGVVTVASIRVVITATSIRAVRSHGAKYHLLKVWIRWMSVENAVAGHADLIASLIYRNLVGSKKWNVHQDNHHDSYSNQDQVLRVMKKAPESMAMGETHCANPSLSMRMPTKGRQGLVGETHCANPPALALHHRMYQPHRSLPSVGGESV